MSQQGICSTMKTQKWTQLKQDSIADLCMFLRVAGVYHFNRERHYSLLDHVTAISLMFANLAICLLGGLTTFSLVILGVLSAYAFYVRWRGDRGLYALNHGLWHITSVAITIVSLGIYLL
jgi:hypothetical protein